LGGLKILPGSELLTGLEMREEKMRSGWVMGSESKQARTLPVMWEGRPRRDCQFTRTGFSQLKRVFEEVS